MNVLDALIAIIIGWNLIRGFNKGFVEELLSLVGIIASLTLAYKLAPPAAQFLVKRPDSSTVALTGFFLFLIFFLATKYFASIVESKVAESSLGMINNILGFFFGIFRGILIASLVVFLVAAVSPDGYLIKRSSLGGATVPVVDKILKVLDGKVEKHWQKNWLVARKFLSENFNKFKGELLKKEPPKVERNG
jgi:membrane protein required for colicin V production